MLLAIVGLRSLAHMGLFTFIPLYEISRGNGAGYGTRVLALFLFAGALGTLFGGPLADRVGRRKVLLCSFIISPPLIATYVLVDTGVGLVALFFSGAAVIGTFSVSLVMSQEYMPGRVGVASGLSIGLAIGLGGMAALSLGAVADAVDLETALLCTRSRAAPLHRADPAPSGAALPRPTGPEPARRRRSGWPRRAPRVLRRPRRPDRPDGAVAKTGLRPHTASTSRGGELAGCRRRRRRHRERDGRRRRLCHLGSRGAVPAHRARRAEPDGRLHDGEDPASRATRRAPRSPQGPPGLARRGGARLARPRGARLRACPRRTPRRASPRTQAGRPACGS